MLPHRDVPEPPSPRRAVAVFLAVGLVVFGAVGGVLGLLAHRSSTDEAVEDALALTALLAVDVVEPVLTDAVLQPGPARDRLDLVMRRQVLGDRVVRVKVWDESGVIVYSDDPDLPGRRYPLAADDLAAMRGGAPVAEVTDLGDPEHLDEQEFGRLLQVYLGVRTAEGTPLLFETYQSYDTIVHASRRLWASYLPVLAAGLGLLWLAQAPLAWQLASRLRSAHEEREALLIAALAASDRERQRIAADLHDGVVQGLSGASYTLSALAVRAADGGAEQVGRDLRGTAVDLRRNVLDLRSLIVTITPPGLRRQPLPVSVRDLVAPLQDAGVGVRVAVPDDLALDDPTTDLLLRTTQEAVRNILRHAGATSASVEVAADGDDVVLTVRDDGAGLRSAPSGARRRGVGLDLLSGLAQQHGGDLQVTPGPAAGTRLVLRLPRAAREQVLA